MSLECDVRSGARCKQECGKEGLGGVKFTDSRNYEASELNGSFTRSCS